MILNKNVYNVEFDDLIYDGSHPVDGRAVTLSIAASNADGLVAKGQVVDYDDANDKYALHAANGEVYGVVSEDTEYDTLNTTSSVVVPVYLSGALRRTKLVTGVELTEADVEKFREKGIFLK